jgi:nucleoside-diphosphate-sugar epimerase
MSTIFVTGASGFVGRRVVSALVAAGYSVIALSRGTGPKSCEPGVKWLTGDVLDSDTYAAGLADCDTVVHLAAATGNASALEHSRVNLSGTERLVRAAREARIAQFLFVSSIAVTFPRIAGYPYAETKKAAEAVVRKSGLSHVILRPTIVLGQGSPVAGALQKLANLPVVVVPGSGRARVQPIDVDQLACLIAEIVSVKRFENQVIEAGGSRVLTIQDLMLSLRDPGNGRPWVAHLPLFVMRIPLRIAEAVGLGSALPLTAGQLSSFEFDGVANSGPARAVSRELAREARVFARHLLGADATDYVVAQYQSAHDSRPELAAADPFDRATVALGRRHWIVARLVDAGAAVLRPRGILRRKMVLLVAILESAPPFHTTIDSGLGNSRAVAVARMFWTGTVAAALVLVGVLVLAPVLLISFAGQQRR